jgi:O-antigen ligase
VTDTSPAPGEPDPAASASPLVLAALAAFGWAALARPAAFSLTPYTQESGFACLGLLVFAALAWLAAWRARARLDLPVSLCVLGLAWWALHAWGALNSPDPGLGWARLYEQTSYLLAFVAACWLARAYPASIPIMMKTLLAGALCLAVVGFWQYAVLMPSWERQGLSGLEHLPSPLRSQQGLERLRSREVFATFGNANQFAGFLLIPLCLGVSLTCVAWKRDGARKAGLWVVVLALLGLALFLSGGKGAWVVGALAVAWLAARWALPERRAWLAQLGLGAGALAVVLALAAGTAGYAEGRWGASLEERFGYWRAGLAMVSEQPWTGRGLAGFAEYYADFKLPTGTEVKEAHNDWLQLWIELGLLAPLVWAGWWWSVCRQRSTDLEAPYAESAVGLHRWAAGGGVFALVVLSVLLLRLEGGKAWLLFDQLLGVPPPLPAYPDGLGPLLYLAAWCGAWWLVKHAWPSAPTGPDPTVSWQPGAWAAIVAILLHQLVDFDLQGQGLLLYLFVLAGLLTATARQTPAVRAEATPAPWFRAWTPRVALGLALPVLLWCGALRPLARGWAEEEALYQEELSRQEPARTQQVVSSLAAARRWADFDARVHEQLALALARQEAAGFHEWPAANGEPRQTREAIPYLLKQAQARRPRAAYLRLLDGHYHLAQAARTPSRARQAEHLTAAARAYDEAAARYPLAPMPRLCAGDALLLAGKVEAAALRYRRAWDLGGRITDRNTRLLSIFHDPYPGCLPRHGLDAAVYEAAEAVLRQRPEDAFYFLMSLALHARVLLDDPEHGAVWRERFLAATAAMVETRRDDARAQLWRYWAVRRFGDDAVKAELATWEPALRAAFEAAPEAYPAPLRQELRQVHGLPLP